VLTYHNADGTSRREFRPPEEVFAADSLASLRDAPVVIGHPAMIDSQNWEKLSVGHVSGGVKPEGNLVTGYTTVQKADALAKVDSGELCEQSCGYKCKIDETPGTYDGQPYDVVQRSIQYNHVGLGPKGWGRAGSDVSLRLDGVSDTILELTPTVTQTHEAPPMKVRFDGVEYDAGSAEHVQALENKLDGQTQELTKVTTERDTVQAKLDSATQTQVDLQTKLDAATSQERIDGLVNARVGLVVDAVKVLGTNAKLDGKTDREIMTDVVAVTHPAIKLDGKSDDYVKALFDAGVASGTRADSISRLPGILNQVETTDATEPSSEDDEYEKKRAERSKKPLTFTKEKS
jgi:hypothetical protein